MLLESLIREVALTGRFRKCDRIVRLLGASMQDPEHLCLIMELLPGGSLHDRLYKRPNHRQLTYLEIVQVRLRTQVPDLLAEEVSLRILHLIPEETLLALHAA